MTDFKTSKTKLAELLKTKKISFHDWGDALSLHFSDGCDDLHYTKSKTESPAEIIEKFQMLNISRSRILSALRHAAVKRSLFLELDKSGTWSVGSVDGASWSVEVGSELTKIINEQGEARAFRVKLKELYSWESSAGCLGALVQGGVMVYQKKVIRGIFKIIVGSISTVASGLAKNIMSSISIKSTDKQIISYIDSHSKPPRHEYTWEEFEQREDERECIENFAAKEDEDFQDFFNKFQKEGPSLIEPDEHQKNKIDKSTASRLELFLRTLDKERLSYEKIILPWFNAPYDVWLKSNSLIEKLEAQALEARKNDDFWSEVSCLEQLLILKCDKYRERTCQLLDEWWQGGGHDMQDYPELLNAFPEHPATVEMLDVRDMLPETSMKARRKFVVDIQREWEELKNFYKKDRLVKLDDILEIMNKLSVDMIKKIMTEEQIHYVRRFCMEAVKGATVEDMQFSHEHILHTAWKMDWPEIAKTLRQRDDYSDLLFGFCMPASEIKSLSGKMAETVGAEVSLPKDIPETFDTYYFAKSLLIWSLFMPDEYTQRLIATALDLLNRGKGGKDDYLACGIAWQRCRSVKN